MTRMELRRMLSLVGRADSMSPGEFAELDALSKKATRAMQREPQGEVATALAALSNAAEGPAERFDGWAGSAPPSLADIRAAVDLATNTAIGTTKPTYYPGDGPAPRFEDE